MEVKGSRLLLCVLLAAHCASSQNAPKKPGKKEGANTAAIEELKKQVENIMQELSLLKEQLALLTVCLKGTKIHGKCLLADGVKKQYHTASEDCIAKGGTLSVPRTDEENEQLHEYVRQSMGPEEHVWLGINDMASEGDWVDHAAFSVRYKNWETEITHQPDGGRVHNCVVLSTTANGKWFDENCRAEKASVCEFNII
ncbi:tetranectin-like [Scleropages formosus]|uniref:Tetranectin-like n=1 Tax=Scleropages formosus TaxID=113540 RepID=A0A0P7TMI4_SCLFO|nr:tetranectin-like [Scleropages formosus]